MRHNTVLCFLGYLFAFHIFQTGVQRRWQPRNANRYRQKRPKERLLSLAKESKKKKVTWKKRKLLQPTTHRKTYFYHFTTTMSPFSPTFSLSPCDIIRGQVESLGFYHHQVVVGSALPLLLSWCQWQLGGESGLSTLPSFSGWHYTTPIMLVSTEAKWRT